MDNINLIDSFSELKDVKNIDKETMIRVMQDVFRTIITKKYGSSQNFDIIVNPNKGDLEIWRNRTIVEDGYEDFDENIHISLTDAKKVESIRSYTSERSLNCSILFLKKLNLIRKDFFNHIYILNIAYLICTRRYHS